MGKYAATDHRRRPSSTRELFEDAIRQVCGSRRRPRRAGRQTRTGGAPSSTCARSISRRSARRDRRLPRQVRDQVHRRRRRAAHRVEPSTSTARRCASTSQLHAHRVRAARAGGRAPSATAAATCRRRRSTSRPTGTCLRSCCGSTAPSATTSRSVCVSTTAPCTPGASRAVTTEQPSAGRHHARRRARHRRLAGAWRRASSRPPPRARGREARSAARLRAPVRLPRALPDQEPPLLHHLQGAARGARRPPPQQLVDRSTRRRETRRSATPRAARGPSRRDRLRKAGDALLAASSAARARERSWIWRRRWTRAEGDRSTGGGRERRARRSSARAGEPRQALAAVIAGDESGLRQLAELIAPYLPATAVADESDRWLSTREAAEYAGTTSERAAQGDGSARGPLRAGHAGRQGMVQARGYRRVAAR